MIEHIGSVDSELRDKLIYSSFFELIIERNSLGQDVLTGLMEYSLDHLLMKGLGENGTDTVFTRAFTTLLMALILYRDGEEPFLSDDLFARASKDLMNYFMDEKDLRGYVPEKGWAHSVAHASDAIDEMVKHPKFDRKLYPEILKLLLDKVLISESVYIHKEDERILHPILRMLAEGLDAGEVETLLQSLPERLREQKQELLPEHYYFLEFNCAAFLKTFYLKLEDRSETGSLQETIRELWEIIGK
ncbi:DUF2785 domain-containing protein [Peribacillus sp. SCS-26]|uniref:DUF2785 domain-containing protein n=1 Tax=Paraperibacillus marinus TaxID=3115295 RepID=UPI0039060E27